MASRVEDRADMRDFAADVPTIHSYPMREPYWNSGHPDPQPGDVALCGHVKQVPHDPSVTSETPLTCLMCARLEAMGL